MVKAIARENEVFEIPVKIGYGFIGMVLTRRSLNYQNVMGRPTSLS
jgi:hypothetical protein